MAMTLFFFNDTATTEIYTLSLHDALPISLNNLKSLKLIDVDYSILPFISQLTSLTHLHIKFNKPMSVPTITILQHIQDRKSTRLNSSHANISYAVFCLKKKNEKISSVSAA